MIIDIITIFPRIFEDIVEYGVIKEAFNRGSCVLNLYDLRDFTDDRYRKVDDRPYGGGPGMVLMVGPLDRAISHIRKKNAIKDRDLQKTILLTPGGEKLQQACFRKLSVLENLILICGRYEGVDERIRNLVDMEISIGDYVLTGGELPAMVIIDTVARLIPGVLGNQDSIKTDSFFGPSLGYPQYTRPPIFRGLKVPQVLLGGNHNQIDLWRKKKSLERTRLRRPDILKN